jgi:hypothetical protein
VKLDFFLIGFRLFKVVLFEYKKGEFFVENIKNGLFCEISEIRKFVENSRRLEIFCGKF